LLQVFSFCQSFYERTILFLVSDLSIDAGNITVLHDELDRGLGKCRWKMESSAK